MDRTRPDPKAVCDEKGSTAPLNDDRQIKRYYSDGGRFLRFDDNDDGRAHRVLLDRLLGRFTIISRPLAKRVLRARSPNGKNSKKPTTTVLFAGASDILFRPQPETAIALLRS